MGGWIGGGEEGKERGEDVSVSIGVSTLDTYMR